MGYGTKFQKKWLAQRSGGSVLARFDYDYYLKQESLYTKLYIDQYKNNISFYYSIPINLCVCKLSCHLGLFGR